MSRANKWVPWITTAILLAALLVLVSFQGTAKLGHTQQFRVWSDDDGESSPLEVGQPVYLAYGFPIVDPPSQHPIYIDGVFLVGFDVVGKWSGSNAYFSVSVPNDPTLVGVTFAVQPWALRDGEWETSSYAWTVTVQ